MKNDFVVGFLFSPDKQRIVLMEKKRPEWQVGLLNGPGGRIKEDETPYAAIEREFKEETGASGIFWRPFCRMQSGKNHVIFFVGVADVEVKQMTDEPVAWHDFSALDPEKMVRNLWWLLPLALDEKGATASVIEPMGEDE
jgi:8-oxo-dGTP diphosphatase